MTAGAAGATFAGARLLRACLILAMTAWASAGAATLRWIPDEAPPRVEAEGLPEAVLDALARRPPDDARWADVLAVFAEQADASSIPAMTGRWSIVNGGVRFDPAFPLAPGVRYRAVLRLPDTEPLVSRFALPPDQRAASTQVLRVLPSAAVLPENQLKFYIEFSAPMSRGGTYEHIKLRDARGRAVELPFLELDEELWDPGMTRLTLLIDPGRIKRGVKPLEDIGPVFEAGKTYTLTVDRGCRDASGRTLQAAHTKSFSIGPADRTAPDPARWTLHPPRAGARSALVVVFDEPMDEALALRLIGVVAVGETATPLRGEAVLDDQERRWSFVPEQAWAPGRHRLVVASTIEDLAGNNVGKTFDVDLAAGARRQLPAASVSVPFEVK